MKIVVKKEPYKKGHYYAASGLLILFVLFLLGIQWHGYIQDIDQSVRKESLKESQTLAELQQIVDDLKKEIDASKRGSIEND